MQFSLTKNTVVDHKTDCIIIKHFNEKSLNATLKSIDTKSNGLIKTLEKQGDLSDKLGQTTVLYHIPGIEAKRVIIVGCGERESFSTSKQIKALSAAINKANELNVDKLLIALDDTTKDAYWDTRHAIQLAANSLYNATHVKSKKTIEKPKLKSLQFTAADKHHKAIQSACKDGGLIAGGVTLSKTLGDLPGNVCTPTYLAKEAQSIARGNTKVTCKVIDEKEFEKLKMGSFLSVAKGSDQSGKLITIEYKGGKKNEAPVVLIGKGITFDSGGISLKPGAAMDEMKYDMCGAASVLGATKAVIELGLPVNLVTLVPTCENMPSGRASKPGDVVTSMSGQTIEILNTDAEGRLILCDALTYAERFKPDVVIDVATLTGACVIALGGHASGLMSNSEKLAKSLMKAGDNAFDRVWQLPIWDEYQESLNSNFADMANIGGREAGTITAACFLSRFAEKFDWAHLDIAGSAWLGGKQKGATGRPVPLLVEYIMDRTRT